MCLLYSQIKSCFNKEVNKKSCIISKFPLQQQNTITMSTSKSHFQWSSVLTLIIIITIIDLTTTTCCL